VIIYDITSEYFSKPCAGKKVMLQTDEQVQAYACCVLAQPMSDGSLQTFDAGE